MQLARSLVRNGCSWLRTSAMMPRSSSSSSSSSGSRLEGSKRLIRASTAAEASENQGTSEVVDWSEEWINTVGVTGVVLQGPELVQYKDARCKALVVLGLFSGATGDPFVDKARPVLVQAWNEKAIALTQQLQLNQPYFVQGHLALDYGSRESAENCPALQLVADKWWPVATETIPQDRIVCQRAWEFNDVMRKAAARSRWSTSSALPAAVAGDTAPAGPAGPAGISARADTYARAAHASKSSQPYVPPWGAQALQLLMLGADLQSVAAQLSSYLQSTAPEKRMRRLRDACVGAAEQQGLTSPAWSRLLQLAGLDDRQTASDLFEEVSGVIAQSAGGPVEITSDGEPKMRPLREHLLSPGCKMSQLVMQQEQAAGGDADITYFQLRLLLTIKKLGGHPSELLV